MNCKQLRSLLETQMIAEFSPMQSQAADEHAKECLECQSLLIDERRLDSILRELPEPESDSDLSPRVMAIIREHKKPGFLSGDLSSAQTGEWPITMIVTAFAMSLCTYSYEILNGRWTVFNLFSFWAQDWTHWFFHVPQLNLIGFIIAASFLAYLAGFLLLFQKRE